jgi:NADPH-dependent ferric siderophore reductase
MNRRVLGPREIERLTLDTGPWLSCDDCFDLVDEYVERLLAGDLTAQPAMRAHLRGCPACAEEAAALAVLAAEEVGQDPASALVVIGR